eukprot:SAG25_NODE_315_length_9978_cov_10.651483_3_plen_265_part_00
MAPRRRHLRPLSAPPPPPPPPPHLSLSRSCCHRGSVRAVSTLNVVIRTGATQANLSQYGHAPLTVQRSASSSLCTAPAARVYIANSPTVHEAMNVSNPPIEVATAKTVLMKTISRVTGIPLQFHSCHLRFLSCMPAAHHQPLSCSASPGRDMTEAPWVSTPATLAGRWRAQRLNNACCWPRACGLAARKSIIYRCDTGDSQSTQPPVTARNIRRADETAGVGPRGVGGGCRLPDCGAVASANSGHRASMRVRAGIIGSIITGPG